jgi:site-specific recombinase XerC
MPPWFLAVATQWAESDLAPKNAARHLLRVERALLGGAASTSDILASVAGQPNGRATAVLLLEFFDRHGMAGGPRPAAADSQRRQRVNRIPPPMRRAVGAYIDQLTREQERAALYGGNGLSDKTISYQLAIIARFAEHLAARGLPGWAAVTAPDIEAYLAKDIARQLTTLKSFFAFARQRKVVLVNPASGLSVRQRKGYTGPLLTASQQRDLLTRWQRGDPDPRERVVGLLCLLHAASNSEVRHLRIADIADDRSALRLGTRPHPLPVDPFTADAITACLDQHAETGSANSYLLIGFQTRLHDKPCSIEFPRRILQRAGPGVTPQVLRATRLSDLTHRLDPRVVAEALDITHEAALHYVIGAVQREDVAFGDTWES